VDIGLSTNALAPMLTFWQGEAGALFDHVLPIRRGQDQHRHDVNGSVLKINHHDEPLPDAPASGYRELIIARADLDESRRLADPDGNLVTLAPPGWRSVTQIGVVIAVRDLGAHRRFWREAFGLVERETDRDVAFAAGESLLILEPAANAAGDATSDAAGDASLGGRGGRYVTFQVFKVDEAHAQVLAAGGAEGLAPVTLGTTARISMVRDPDGNFIELSQRASIVGSLT
jgi:lactoylglutathione lyase